MKKDAVKKRTLIWLFAGLLVLLAALILLGVFLYPHKKKPEEEPQEIRYHLANYEENIFLNKAYMSFQRDLTFSSSGVEQIFSYEEDYETASKECKFFLDYFHTVINGDYDSLPDYYVEGYFSQKPKFTMQMIYEPYVIFHSVSTEKIDGVEQTLYNFSVQYRIFRNNGTFRQGVSSNTAVPQIYQLIKTSDGSYRIYRILEVRIEEDS